MTFETHYSAETLTRAAVEALPGLMVLEFGANGCGFCQAAQADVRAAVEPVLASHRVRHVKVEDGPGRPLGRSFRVKLWPTLIFLKDGQEVDRVVRPGQAADVAQRVNRLVG